MSWKEKTLGDGIHIKHGYAFKSKFFTENDKYIVLTPGNFFEEGGFKIRPNKDRSYSGDIPESYILSKDDLIVAMTEQGEGLLGSSALIPEDDKFLHNQRLGLLDNIDPKVFNKKFLYYLFNTRSVRHQISGSATGTKVKHTSPDRIYRVKVKVPDDVNEQNKIADILSRYDETIANNRRRIELLERSSRLLYREWFVHLRYPGHEHGAIGPDGIPEGWEKKSLSELAEYRYGYTASARHEPDDAKFLRITDIVPETIDWQSVPYCSISDTEYKKFSLEKNDVVVARTGATVGYAKRIGKVNYPLVFASYLVRFRFNNELSGTIASIFMESEMYKDFVRNNAGGAAQPNANAQILSSANILVPPKSLQDIFCEIVEPINDQKELLQAQNQKLQSARDLLLPRLMNGEINV